MSVYNLGNWFLDGHQCVNNLIIMIITRFRLDRHFQLYISGSPGLSLVWRVASMGRVLLEISVGQLS